jgi:hypothetical protein
MRIVLPSGSSSRKNSSAISDPMTQTSACWEMSGLGEVPPPLDPQPGDADELLGRPEGLADLAEFAAKDLAADFFERNNVRRVLEVLLDNARSL